MSSDAPWTIERISDALGAPALIQRFLGEINTAPAHQLLTVFAKWERIAKNILDALDEGKEILAAEARGEDPPGEWIDDPEPSGEAEERLGSRGAA